MHQKLFFEAESQNNVISHEQIKTIFENYNYWTTQILNQLKTKPHAQAKKKKKKIKTQTKRKHILFAIQHTHLMVHLFCI